MGDDNRPDHDDGKCGPPPASREQSAPSVEDTAIGKARREAAAVRIREIRRNGQERIDQMFADHLADHGEVTVTSGDDFLRETEAVEKVDAAED